MILPKVYRLMLVENFKLGVGTPICRIFTQFYLGELPLLSYLRFCQHYKIFGGSRNNHDP